ncbi:cupin domain-containing protein [Mesorhizobium sp.]|uniref:cupin domain-containing protein n=1 Tax=Mesorhizobium sp. TaxID=1871066 RepID=UPI0025807E9F|nr:cupin domain-containing protein [Mesorhizobium sp.]
MYAEFKSVDRIGLGAKSVCVPPCASDLLSEVLQDLRLSNATYGRSELTAPWGIQVPFKEGVRFHFVAEGRCLMRSDGLKPVMMNKGDVVLLPHGSAHELRMIPHLARDRSQNWSLRSSATELIA